MSEAQAQPTTEAAAAPVVNGAVSDNGGMESVESIPDSNAEVSGSEGLNGAEAGGESSEGSESLSADEMAQLEALLPKYRRKLKINGAEKELSFNEIDALIQKELAGDMKLQQAAEIEKTAQLQQQQIQHILTALKENPEALMSREDMLGQKGLREFAEKLLIRELKKEMNPEEFEVEEKLSKYEQMQQKLAEYEQREAQKQRLEMESQAEQEIETEIQTALETSKLPKTPYTVQRMAALMLAAEQKGLKVSSSEVAEILEEQYQNDVRQLLGGVGDDKLLNFLGDDFARKIREQDLSRIKSPVPTNEAQPQARTTSPGATGKKKMTMRELDEYTNKILASL